MGEFDGRVALVTGGSRGVGRAVAIELAAGGADVVVNFRREAGAAAEVVQRVEALGRRAIAVGASVADPGDCERLVEVAVTEFGHVDILVNNAGVASRGRPVQRTDPDEVAAVMATHAIGPHHLCRLVLPSMRTRPRGDIVMISSVATIGNAAGGAPYNMAKAAMEALAFTLANEVIRHGIHVNVVAPGLVDTDMGQRLMKAVAGVDDLHALDSSMPLGRVCSASDVASVVAFLCSSKAGYVSGQKINVDGGAR